MNGRQRRRKKSFRDKLRHYKILLFIFPLMKRWKKIVARCMGTSCRHCLRRRVNNEQRLIVLKQIFNAEFLSSRCEIIKISRCHNELLNRLFILTENDGNLRGFYMKIMEWEGAPVNVYRNFYDGTEKRSKRICYLHQVKKYDRDSEVMTSLRSYQGTYRPH